MEAKDSWKNDTKLQKIMDKIRINQGSFKQYTFDGTFLRRKGKVIIGAYQQMKERILCHYHNTVTGGNSGDDLTYMRIKE